MKLRSLYIFPIALCIGVLFACQPANQKKAGEQAEKRVNPFAQAPNIELISFNTDTSGGHFLLSQSNYIDPSRFTEKVFLDSSQREQLVSLFKEQGENISNKSDCYSPKHAILLCGKDSLPTGFVEMAFLCKGYKTSEGLTLNGISANQWIKLEKLFREAGIRQGFVQE